MKAVHKNILIDVADHFGTPTFLYDGAVIEEKYLTLQKKLVPYCDVFYSMKANPTLAICEKLSALGAHCEVSSRHEMIVALTAGFLPHQIIFVGPGKKEDEIEFAVQKNIKAIICESIDEIARVNLIARKYQTPVPIFNAY